MCLLFFKNIMCPCDALRRGEGSTGHLEQDGTAHPSKYRACRKVTYLGNQISSGPGQGCYLNSLVNFHWSIICLDWSLGWVKWGVLVFGQRVSLQAVHVGAKLPRPEGSARRGPGEGLENLDQFQRDSPKPDLTASAGLPSLSYGNSTSHPEAPAWLQVRPLFFSKGLITGHRNAAPSLQGAVSQCPPPYPHCHKQNGFQTLPDIPRVGAGGKTALG